MLLLKAEEKRIDSWVRLFYCQILHHFFWMPISLDYKHSESRNMHFFHDIFLQLKTPNTVAGIL